MPKYQADEKKWMMEINNGEIKNVLDFINKSFRASIKPHAASKETIISLPGDPFGPKWQSVNFQHGESILDLEETKDVEILATRFSKLLYNLAGMQFVEMVIDPNFNLKLLPFFKQEGHSHKTNKIGQIFTNNAQYEYVPNLRLEEFIRSDFLSDDERERVRAEQRAERAESRNIKIAISVPVIGFILQLGIAWFQYITYSNMRQVELKNYKSLPDTLQVRIIHEINDPAFSTSGIPRQIEPANKIRKLVK